MQKLERLLNDSDVEVRRGAVEQLRGKPDKTRIGFLLKAMEDPSWRVRNTATEILIEEYEIESYIHRLINLLYLEDNAGARNSSIDALIRLHSKATPFLIEAFNTPNRDVRKFIIDVLGEQRDRRTLPLMLSALKDDDENVRATAIEHIGSGINVRPVLIDAKEASPGEPDGLRCQTIGLPKQRGQYRVW